MSGLREPREEDFSLGLLALEAPVQSSTIRPPQSSKVPVSLRSLFPEEEPSDNNEPPATPVPFQYPPPTLALPPLLIPTTPGRSGTARKLKRLGEADHDDPQHTHRPGFVFPPRPKQTADVEKPPEPKPKTNSPKAPSAKFPSPSTSHHPPLDEKSAQSDDGNAEPTPSPGEYRFPMSNGLPTSVQRPLHLPLGRGRRPPTPDSLDRIHTAPTHQSTHSLDAVPSGRKSPSGSRSAPNNALALRRTRNNSPDELRSGPKLPPLRPNITRQASVAVMETVPSPPLLPPVPPLVRQRRRSGNSVSGNSDFLSPNIPGLKDVLKVCPPRYHFPCSDPLTAT